MNKIRAITQTDKMIEDMNNYLNEHSLLLQEGFEEMNYSKVYEACKKLNLFAHRAYDLGVKNHYAQFKETTTFEFMSLILEEFQKIGVEVNIPSQPFEGSTIYFNLNEYRLGALYSGHKSVRLRFNSNDFDSLNMKEKKNIQKQLDYVQVEREKISAKITLWQQLLDNPALIKSKAFRDEHKKLLNINYESRQGFMGRLGLLREGKFFDRIISQWNSETIFKKWKHPDTKEKMKKRIQSLENQLDLLENESELKARIDTLSSLENHNRDSIEGFVLILKKFKIGYVDEE